MAGLGKKTFVAGEVLRAADVNGYLMDQSVQVYAGTAARGSAIGTAVSEGMVSYLTDTNLVQVYDGSTWGNTYGLIPIKPTSAAVGSGSYSISEAGVVTATGASTISLNGVFTSAFRNYRIVANLASNSFSRGQIRFRNSGTDRTNSNYWYNCVETSTGSGSVTVTSGEAVTAMDILYFDDGYQNSTVLDVFNPMISNVPKHVHIRHSRRYSGGAGQASITAGFDNTATSDGFTWYGSTWSGTLQVFGYNG